MFALFWFVCLLVEGALAQTYTVITPNSYSIIGYTGQPFTIQADASSTPPTTYTAALSCTSGSTPFSGPFAFNAQSSFTQTSAVKGRCTVSFAVGEIFGFGQITIFSAVSVSSTTSVVQAGTSMFLTVTTTFPGVATINAVVQCTTGSEFSVSFFANTFSAQEIDIPSSVAGTCSMTTKPSSLENYYQIAPFQFQVYNLDQMSIISPPEFPAVTAYSGGTFTIQADNDGNYPQTYDCYLTGGLSGSDSPTYTYSFNSSYEFPVPDTTRGSVFVYFNLPISSPAVNLGIRQVNVYAAIEITSTVTSINAGSVFYYNATSNYSTFSAPVNALFNCTFGEFSASVNVNTNVEQSVSVPADVSGDCVMQATTEELASYFYIIPYTLEVSNELVIQVISSTTAASGSTVTLLVANNVYSATAATLTLTCPTGSPQVQDITTATSPTDFIYFALNADLGGSCLFTLSNFADYYAAGTASLTVLPSINPVLYTFPINKLVRWPGERRRRLGSRFRAGF